MQLLRLVLVSATALVAHEAQAEIVRLPAGTTWANLAWGFNNGGQDDVSGAQAVLVDLDSDPDLIASLRASGKIVICYISAGTVEPFRDDVRANQALWESIALGELAQWDERWLDITQLDVLAQLISPRLDRAAALGCHATEHDNVDCFDNEDECYSLIPSLGGDRSAAKRAQRTYNLWQAEAAHARGLAIGLKNAVGLVNDLVGNYDFAVSEECERWSVCGMLEPFIDEDKAVFHVEYAPRSRCAQGQLLGFSSKYCEGSESQGLCTGSPWVNCFADVTSPLPTGRPTAVGATSSPAALPQETQAPTPFPVVPPPSASRAPSRAPTPRALTLPPTLPGGSVPATVTWANLAWGWPSGGSDSVSGVHAILVDLDFFSADELQAAKARGQLVACYFSAGTVESFRGDVQSNPAAWAAASIAPMAKWPEQWLDIQNLPALQALMRPRLQRARDRGCDIVEGDNSNCIVNAECRDALRDPGTAEQAQVVYNRWLASEAHSLGLLIALKNTLVLAADLVDDFDMLIVESCGFYGTCDLIQPFSAQGKAVWATEYEMLEPDTDAQCASALRDGMLLKICDGSADAGLCGAGSGWRDCFERPGGAVDPPPPPKVWLPASPVAWATLGGVGGTAARESAASVAESQLVIIDLHDAESGAPNAPLVEDLVNAGHHVVCAFSVGAYEAWRPDSAELSSAILPTGATTLQGLPWLNVAVEDAVEAVHRVMGHRVDLAATIGCHGVLLRDGDCSETRACRRGWGLPNMNQRANAEPYQIEHNRWVAERATARGLLAAHHAAPSLADDLEPWFDFAVAEGCVARQNCDAFEPFLAAGKPVLNLEFALDVGNGTCSSASEAGVDTKMCSGTIEDRTCDASEWRNCFAAVQVTPWPSPSPNVASSANGDHLSMWAWTAVIVGVPVGTLALAVGWLQKRRRKHLLELQGKRLPSSLGGKRLSRGRHISLWRSAHDASQENSNAAAALAASKSWVSPTARQPSSYSAWLRDTHD